LANPGADAVVASAQARLEQLDLPLWPLAIVYVLASLLAAVVVRNALKAWLGRIAEHLDPHFRMVLERALPRPAGAALFLFAISVGMRFYPLNERIEAITKHVLPFLFGTLAVAVVMRIALTAITAYGESNPALKSTAGIGRAITWVVGMALMAVLVSEAIGVSLAPALTALGVGSLSVALALQDTLSNFFAGVYLLLDKPIRPGEFVRLDGGQEGYVETIGWRSTHLRTLAPSVVIVPNATLSKAVITNFRDKNPRLLLATSVDVSFDAQPEAIEPMLREVAERAVDVAGVDASLKPFVRFTLGDRGLTFTLYTQATASADGGLVQQEVRRRALVRLREAGVKLAEPNPFGRRT
jgi:small-conductance mechanosensitive channel